MIPIHEHTYVVEKILKGARWATILRLFAQIFSWLSTIIVVRFISPEDYGLNSMLESPMVLMMLLCTFGLDVSLLQAKKLEREDMQGIFGWLLIINLLLFLAYFFGAGLLAVYFKEPRLEILARVLATTFLLIPFRVIPNALLDRNLDFKLRAQLELISTVLAATITLSLAYLGAGIWALIAGGISNRLIATSLLMVIRPWFVSPRFNRLPSSRSLAMGGLLTLAGAFSLLSDQLANLIGGPRLGPELLGVLALGSQFASLPMAKFMPIINQTMIPSFARFRDSPEIAWHYFEKMLCVTAIIMIPMLAGMACLSDEIVPTLYGITWELSIFPLLIMSIGMMFRLNTVLLKNFMLSMGNANISLNAGVLQFVILLPLTLYATSYGATGLAAAWTLAEFLVAVSLVMACSRIANSPFRKLLNCYRPALVSSSIMVIGVRLAKLLLFEGHSVVTLVSLIVVGIIFYILSTRLLFRSIFYLTLTTIFGDSIRLHDK